MSSPTRIETGLLISEIFAFNNLQRKEFTAAAADDDDARSESGLTGRQR